MICNFWVLVGSAIHNIHPTIEGCYTGTSWISADRDSKLGKFCVCSMHAFKQRQPICKGFLPILIFAGLIFALLSFSAKHAKIRTPRK